MLSEPCDTDAAVALLDLQLSDVHSDPIKHERESSSTSGSPPNSLWVEVPARRKDALMKDQRKPQIYPDNEFTPPAEAAQPSGCGRNFYP